MQVYFDNSATTPVRAEAVEAMVETMTRGYGNPSSGHRLGREALDALDTARRRVAKALGSKPGEIYFTSGGTEADNWAVLSGARLRRRGRVIISDTEHEAVKNPAELLGREGYDVVRVKPDRDGRITLPALLDVLTEDTVLVSIMLVNNETGAVNPVKELAAAVHGINKSALFHTDAVQAFGKLSFSPKSLGADLVSVSSHKIMGPKGAGALYIRDGVRIAPLILGGGQEREMRSGTEAMPAIVGFGKAAQLAGTEQKETYSHLSLLRKTAAELIAQYVPEAVFIGAGDAPHILSISLPGWRSETLMNYLDAKGICVSNASACRRGRRSEVLTAMGLPADVIDGALRLSFAAYNTVEEAEYFAKTLAEAAASLQNTGKRN